MSGNFLILPPFSLFPVTSLFSSQASSIPCHAHHYFASHFHFFQRRITFLICSAINTSIRLPHTLRGRQGNDKYFVLFSSEINMINFPNLIQGLFVETYEPWVEWSYWTDPQSHIVLCWTLGVVLWYHYEFHIGLFIRCIKLPFDSELYALWGLFCAITMSAMYSTFVQVTSVYCYKSVSCGTALPWVPYNHQNHATLGFHGFVLWQLIV